MCTCSESYQNCFCYWNTTPLSTHTPERPYWGTGEAWHRVTPKRKSGDRVTRDPSQRRMLKYNYRCQHPHEYLEVWQVESTIHPRHLRWARRKREALRTAGHRCRRRQGCPKGVKSLVAWLGTE